MPCTFCCLSIDLFLNAKLSQRTTFLWQQARRKWHTKEEEKEEKKRKMQCVNQLWEIYMRQIDQISDWVNDRMNEWMSCWTDLHLIIWYVSRQGSVALSLLTFVAHSSYEFGQRARERERKRRSKQGWLQVRLSKAFRARNSGRGRQNK